MRRLHLGRHLRVVSQTSDGVLLEGSARLRPGHVLDLVLEDAADAGGVVRRVFVQSWMVTRLGSDGPMYSGHCRWE